GLRFQLNWNNAGLSGIRFPTCEEVCLGRKPAIWSIVYGAVFRYLSGSILITAADLPERKYRGNFPFCDCAPPLLAIFYST
ncbi:hypothetical protein, partial [Victivallis vadensis]|uniref:hypothetical protein n=1 Tax=Victivallis vadensis TaxID=172901 RepID=UPI003AF820C2